MVQIRDMKKEDAPAVSRIYSDSWRNTYQTFMADDMLEHEIAKRFSIAIQEEEADNPDILTILAVDDGMIVGVSSSSMDERNQAWIDRMHIVPTHQGRGISHQLMTATLAKHSGLQSIALKVLADNERAIRVYERHGFSKTDVIANDPNVGGSNTVVMSRTLPRR